MTYSSCLHDQQDLCWGNTSKDTSEESQESQSPQLLIYVGHKFQRNRNFM